MCLVPKIAKAVNPVGNTTPKDPVYLHNRYLDGLGIGSEARGRNGLRIDPGTPASHAPVVTTPGPGNPRIPRGPGNRWRLGIDSP